MAPYSMGTGTATSTGSPNVDAIRLRAARDSLGGRAAIPERPERIVDAGEPIDRDCLERQDGHGDLDHEQMERSRHDPERDDEGRGASGRMRRFQRESSTRQSTRVTSAAAPTRAAETPVAIAGGACCRPNSQRAPYPHRMPIA